MRVVVIRSILIGSRVENGLHSIEDIATPKVSLHCLLLAHGGKPSSVGEAISGTVHLLVQMVRKGRRTLLDLLVG
jgi:hypothetical protein